MRRNYGLSATLTISEVSSLGNSLNYENDIYLSLYIFGQFKETRLLPAQLPAFFNDQFFLSKTFYMEDSPESVLLLLYDEPVYIKLFEVSSGLTTLLASYTTNARDLLFPYPTSLPYSSSYGREFSLLRTVNFPDYLSPKLRFSVSSQLTPTYPPYYEPYFPYCRYYSPYHSYYVPPYLPYYEPPYLSYQKAPKREKRGRSLVRRCPSYERPTYSSISRSVSPKKESVGVYSKVPNYRIDTLRDALERLERDLSRARQCLN